MATFIKGKLKKSDKYRILKKYRMAALTISEQKSLIYYIIIKLKNTWYGHTYVYRLECRDFLLEIDRAIPTIFN